MRHHFLPSSISTTTTMSSTSKPLKSKPPSTTTSNFPNYPSSTTSYCKHSSPTGTTLDLLILILVLFSGTFLLTSYCSYIINSLSLLLPSLSFSSFASYLHHSINPNHLYYVIFSISFVTILTLFEICCLPRSRKCGKIKCKGLKKCMEFDLQLVKEGSLKVNGCNNNGGFKSKNEKSSDWTAKEIDELPWKGGSENNPDYECLRAELRKMAPPNGKAVLLFRAKCGCPVAKLEGWGPKRGRRLKKSPALNGSGDHH